jgi:ribosome-associated protein
MDEPENQFTPAGIEVGPGVFVPESAIRFGFARSGGPGGQNVNKLNTKVELWIALDALSALPPDAVQRLVALTGKRLTKEGEIHLTAETARTQERNREVVLEKLRQLLIAAMKRPKVRRKTKPTRASRQRRLESKRHRGEIKARRRGGES